MATSLLLDNVTWDICLDSNGNIAVCDEPYSIAQNVATAIRLFKTEYWYDTDIGVPYFEQVLGKLTPMAMVKALIVKEAKTVPDCIDPVLYVTNFQNRRLEGQIQFLSPTGQTFIVALTPRSGQFILGVSTLGTDSL